MSPVFRHGRLRLYLLKLLDDSPRHGYEVIRILQDRFLGVYAPSPGTVYPRLARLEADGLVAHDTSGGRKVYRITDKGRQELRSRLGDLADVEEEIAASVRDISRELTQDVRRTVRSLRDELIWPAREPGTPAREPGTPPRGRDSGGLADGCAARDGRAPVGSRERAGGGNKPAAAGGAGAVRGPSEGLPAEPGRPASLPLAPHRDLDRLAWRFARDLRTAAWHGPALSEDALGDLRTILDEALDRARAEVFGAPGDAMGQAGPGSPSAPGAEESGPGPASSALPRRNGPRDETR